MAKPYNHILVIRFSAMGDVAMAVPVLRALSHQHPNLKITVLTKEGFSALFRDIKNLNVFEADLKDKHKGVLGLYKLYKDLKIKPIDAVADLHQVIRTQLLRLFFFRIPFAQINKGRAEKKALIHGKTFKPLKTTHQRYTEVFKALGFPIDLSKIAFPNKPKLSNTLKKQLGPFKTKVIGIAPFATYKGKMYPLDRMELVVKHFCKSNTILLLGGGQQEKEKLEGIVNKFNNTINVAGRFTLEQELDIISNLDLMLAMDSANAHLAAMQGVKTITIWGVTHPYSGFYPFNQPEEYALLADREQFPLIPTSVYGNKYPKNYVEASRSISTNKVIETIKKVL